MLNRLLQKRSLAVVQQLNRVCSSSANPRTVRTIQQSSVIQSELHTPDRKFYVGKQYHGFECIRIEHIPEFSMMSYNFRHLGTGTEVWHLERNDPNNVFSINFRTTPFDSSGLPHILEHSVLCGSQKYPVRDPFFKMLNRSVATFMNAMTGPDYTLYPFSTMNETDYRNLQRIYLDAVFKPNLEYLDFLQEGWRLEHSDINDKSSEYVLKGVVYNEMKGAFSANASVFGQSLLNNLLPDNTYGYVSGGNPLEIPKLTHQNLVDFHRKYYHPSNARIYTYGTFDMNKTLKYIDGEYLCKYDYIDSTYSRIPSQKRWDKPRTVHITSRFDKMGAPFDRQNQIAISLLMSDVTNIQENFVLYLLSELLIRGPNSPFYKSLIEPNLSGGYNQTTGYDAQTKDTSFTVGLQDIGVEDFPRVEELFEKTLQQVIAEGFEPNHVESVLHNIELSLKHQSPRFGIGLLFNSTPLWNHDGDVATSLRVSQMIADLRTNLQQDPQYLQKKVEKYFTNNPHKLTLIMSPDDQYEDNFKTAELNMLKQKIISLTEVQRNEIYENGLKLAEAQKAPPNTEVLPCLSVNDIKEAPKMETIITELIKETHTQSCIVPTNEICYLKCLIDGSTLTRNEVMLLPLFCDVINDMGTKNYDYRDFDKLVMSKTAGISFKLHFAENIHDGLHYNLGIFMNTHALEKNTEDMFDLCLELMANYKLEDVERMQMLIDQYVSNISVGVADSGHLYAMTSCAGLVTDGAALKAQLAGLEHIEYMKSFVQQNKPQEIMEKMATLAKKLFNKTHMRFAINISKEFQSNFLKRYEKFLDDLPGTEGKIMNHSISLLQPSYQHFVMNIPVNYCAKALFTVPYTHKDHPVLRLLAKLISAKYLLPVVREQNGAYGAGAKIGSDGVFSFFSYRDPNSVKTLEAFDNTFNWLMDHRGELTQQTLFEAKLGVLQQMDAPIAPGNQGIDQFLYGVSPATFLEYRTRLLAVTLDDLHKVIMTYFKKEAPHHGKCILGPENKDLNEQTGLTWKHIL